LGPTYVIAGGYTAGHLTPGLAVAEELRQRHPDLNLLFAGRKDAAESQFVRRHGLSFLALPAAPWACRNAKQRGRALMVTLPAVCIARRRFREAGAVGLLSLGSFATFAPALAARSLGLPVTVFEPNARFGLAHRMLQPIACRVLGSRLFEAGTRPLPRRCEIVGVPLRAAVEAIAAHRPGPPARRSRLLVLGGSLGSPFLNAQVPELARQLVALGTDVGVTHQCGYDYDAAAVFADYQRAGVRAVVRQFFDPIAPVLADADFIVTSAGAITLHEISAARIPLLVTPLRGSAAAHQYANADAFARATGCLTSIEETWNPARLAEDIAAVLTNPERWTEQSRALGAFAAGDARAKVVERIASSLAAAPARA
jgi:UDP-N-acetylglucosamine:LPS N-acetylglucosamine transferase